MKQRVMQFLKVQEQTIKTGGKIFLRFLYWAVISCVTGALIGVVGAGFSYAMSYTTGLREQHPWMIWFLPAIGLVIAFLYHFHAEDRQGTNLVLASIRKEAEIPVSMAISIFFSTVLTHMFGGSAGREGAALQLGGSLSAQFGRWMRMNEDDRHILTMCGMSACFAALFGTPVAAAVFCIEVISVGVMYYAALVPCMIASVSAAVTASLLGIHAESFTIPVISGIDIVTVLRVLVLGILCALVSILFCRTMHFAGFLGQKIKNRYLRIVIGGVIVVAVTTLLGTQMYSGAGMDVVAEALSGTARPESFLLKLLLTAVTLGFGYKGGEIVPSFFVGATFGCVAGGLLGLDPGFGAAIGLAAVFCGVTNCPLSALLMAAELFGVGNLCYFFIAIAVSYQLSGYYGLYSKQKIMYSKYKPEFINIHAK